MGKQSPRDRLDALFVSAVQEVFGDWIGSYEGMSVRADADFSRAFGDEVLKRVRLKGLVLSDQSTLASLLIHGEANSASAPGPYSRNP